jgi:hypothetical protein
MNNVILTKLLENNIVLHYTKVLPHFGLSSGFIAT